MPVDNNSNNQILESDNVNIDTKEVEKKWIEGLLDKICAWLAKIAPIPIGGWIALLVLLFNTMNYYSDGYFKKLKIISLLSVFMYTLFSYHLAKQNHRFKDYSSFFLIAFILPTLIILCMKYKFNSKVGWGTLLYEAIDTVLVYLSMVITSIGMMDSYSEEPDNSNSTINTNNLKKEIK